MARDPGPGNRRELRTLICPHCKAPHEVEFIWSEGGWWCSDAREETSGHIRCDDCGEEFPFTD